MGRLDTRYILKLDTKATFFNPTLSFSINDTETSDLYVRVTNQNKLIDIANMIPVVAIIDPNGQLHSDFMEVTEDNLLYYDIKQSMKAITGKYIAKVMLVDESEKKVLKGNFSYVIEDDEISLLNEKAGEDDRLPILTEFISRLSSIEVNETARQEAEKQREIIKQQFIDDIEKLISDTNKKVDDNLQGNNNKVSKLIEDTKTKIDNYKLDKDEAIQQDLQEYKEKTTQGINTYQSEKDTQINNNLNDYKIDTTRDIEQYKNSKNKELDNYKLEKDTQIDEYVESKNKAIDKYVSDKNKEIDAYKNNKDTLVNNKISEVEAAKQDIIKKSNEKIIEVDNKKNELTTAINEKVNEADERISELQSFESQLQRVEEVNANQNTRLDKVEYVNKRQDVMLGGLFNEKADGRLSIEGEGNTIKLEQSKDGLVEIESVKGNTLVNLCTNSPDDFDLQNSNGTNQERFIFSTRYNLTAGKIYTLLITFKNVVNDNNYSYFFRCDDDLNGTPYNLSNGIHKIVFTMGDKTAVEAFDIRIPVSSITDGARATVSNPIILEGDYTNKSIPTEYFEGMKSTFEDCLVTQDMVDSGEEEEKNLGKYKVEYKVTGKNKFDFDSQEWKQGNGFAPNYGVSEGITIDYINKTIKLTKPSSCIGCHVKLKPNTQYYISCDISNTSTMTVNSSNLGIINKTFTTKDDGIIVFGIGVFNVNTNDGYVLITNIQIEEGEVATPYEPYKESTATVYLDEPLYQDNELTVHDGKLGYWKNWDKIVLDGSDDEKWAVYKNPTTNNIFYIILDLELVDNYKSNVELNRITWNGTKRFCIKNNTIDNLNNFKQYLSENPVTIVYQLAEPVFVPILENTPQWVLESFNDCSIHFNSNIPIASSNLSYTGNVPSVYGMEKSICDIEDHNVDMVATTFDMDYRLLEVEWALEDAGITGINLASTFDLNRKGERAMALSRYEQAKIMILGGAYDKETLTRQLTRYLEKKLITQAEYDELISLMEAKELVTGE